MLFRLRLSLGELRLQEESYRGDGVLAKAPFWLTDSSGEGKNQLTTLKAQVGTAEVPVSSRYFSQQKLSGSG